MRYRTTGQRYFDSSQLDPQLRHGLLGHWVGDGSGPTLRDRSGYGNHGTLTNGPLWTLGPSGKRHALSYVTDDYVNCGASDVLNLSTAFTFAAWISPRTFGEADNGRIIERRNAESTGIIFLVRNTGSISTLALSNPANGQVVVGATGAITLNRWQHVVFALNGQAYEFYVNGVSVGSGTLTAAVAAASGASFVIGYSVYNSLRAFDGLIDDVRVYDRRLSAALIVALAGGNESMVLPQGPAAAAAAVIPPTLWQQAYQVPIIGGGLAL